MFLYNPHCCLDEAQDQQISTPATYLHGQDNNDVLIDQAPHALHVSGKVPDAFVHYVAEHLQQQGHPVVLFYED